MSTPSKTEGIAILAHTAITHPDTLIGSAQDVTTKIAGTIHLSHASVEAVVNTNPGIFLIQTSASASGNEDWITKFSVSADDGTAATEAISGSEAIGQTVIGVASTTGFAANDKIYVEDTGAVVDGEWGLCKEIVSNVSIDLIDGLTNAKDSSDVIWNLADTWAVDFDFSGVGRVRVLFMHEGATGANCHVKALMTTTDSFA